MMLASVGKVGGLKSWPVTVGWNTGLGPWDAGLTTGAGGRTVLTGSMAGP